MYSNSSLENNNNNKNKNQKFQNNLNFNVNDPSEDFKNSTRTEKQNINDNDKDAWINGSRPSTTATAMSMSDNLNEGDSPSSSITSATLTLKGNTYVRPNKKERKGLYFQHEDEKGLRPEEENPVGSVSGSDPGAQEAQGEEEFFPVYQNIFDKSDKKCETGSVSGSGRTSCDTNIITNTNVSGGGFSGSGSVSNSTNSITSRSNNNNCNKIPTLKFSSPSSTSVLSSSSSGVSKAFEFDVDSSDAQELELDEARGVENSSKSFDKRQCKARENENSSTSFDLDESLIAAKGTEVFNPSANSSTVSVSAGFDKFKTSTPKKKDKVDFNVGMPSERVVVGDLLNLKDFNVNQNQNQSHSLSTSTEENFECFGEGSESQSFSIQDSPHESNSLQNFRDLNESELLDCPGGGGTGTLPRPSLSRNAWQRTSLRKTPSNTNGDAMNHKRWGSFRSSTKRGGVAVVPSSNALANQLYRSSSYHSSGRSSAGDGEEMYSDSSLEGEVIDLTKKVHHLEEKFTVLAENQNDVDDRYTRVKQENAELSTKLFMLEEQLRDVELRADEKIREEQRRHKEVLTRIEREKQLQIENYEIKAQMLEKELSSSRIEVKRLENSLERERNENNSLADKTIYFEREISQLREQNRELLAQNRVDRENMAMESAGSQQALVELKKQLESLSHFHMNGSSHSLRRNDSSESEHSELRSRLREAEEEIKRLKTLNHQLQETNEELSAQILNQGLEDGRTLLMNLNTSVGAADGNSLAAEFEAMSNDEMKTALKDSKEANQALRSYIDGILLNIVEHYPQLLEVKNKNSATNGFAPTK